MAGLVFLSTAVASGPAYTADMIPVPSKKPDFVVASVPQTEAAEAQPTTEEEGVAAVDALALLEFGQPVIPPVPKRRPMPRGLEPLSTSDAEIYQRIFAYQAQGNISRANTEIERLKDFRLRGHVLYQRYMHPIAYTASYEELRNWLDLYADHPGAEKIQKMVFKRQPRGSTDWVNKPEFLKGIARVHEPTITKGETYRSPRKRSAAQKGQIKKLSRTIKRDISKGAPTQALHRLKENDAAKLLDPVERDLLQAGIAAGYLYAGKPEKAYQLASQSAGRSGVHVPMAGWIAGLVAWRGEDYEGAARHFEITGRSPYTSGWMAASGAYWAARSHMRTGNVRAVSSWLKRASEHPHTFYGLIATRALGRDFAFNWKIPTYTKENRQMLIRVPAGYRAAALVAAGQINLAEAELVRIDARDNPQLREALLSYAGYAGLPALAMRVGNTMANAEGGFYDAALYPTGPWKPEKGYKVDPALIHAIMRQESRFDPNAKSRSGARGLMQVMPNTANHVAGRRQYKDRHGKQELMDPHVNLDIGQRYLEELMTHNNVSGDLFSLLIAYNAGPGNLARWKREMVGIDDPLLFIESIPSGQTREYIERVLSNYWIYRLREDLPTPTLDSVAAGKNAQYAAMATDEPFRVAAGR